MVQNQGLFMPYFFDIFCEFSSIVSPSDLSKGFIGGNEGLPRAKTVHYLPAEILSLINAFAQFQIKYLDDLLSFFTTIREKETKEKNAECRYFIG